MGPREAALAVSYIGAKTILPLHFGTFPPLTGTPAELAKLVNADVEVVPWNPGDTL
jgi:L-ascorbate metabolism protein UlaG (beta-lactamase superfamily)